MHNDVIKNRPMSMPQSAFHSTPHSRTQSLSQSLPIAQDYSYNAGMNSSEGLGASRNNSQKLYQYDPSYLHDAYRSSIAENRGLMNKVLDGPKQGGIKKRAKLIKKSDQGAKKAKSPKRKVSNKEIKQVKPAENYPLTGNWVRKQNKEDREERKERNKKSLESIFSSL